MEYRDFIRNMTWVGCLAPTNDATEAMDETAVFRMLDQLIPSSRRDKGCPNGRRSPYFRRLVRGEFNPTRNKLRAGERVAPGSTRWFDDPFWRMLSTAPMWPAEFSRAWHAIPACVHEDWRYLTYGDDAPPDNPSELKKRCSALNDDESWAAFKCLFLILRAAEAHRDHDMFDTVRPYCMIGLFQLLFHPTMRFSARFLTLYLLTWIATRGRCALDAIPQRFWKHDELLIHLFAYTGSRLCDWCPLEYRGVTLLNPLAGIVDAGERSRAARVRSEAGFQQIRTLLHQVIQVQPVAAAEPPAQPLT
jgi:hypothetical protein